MRLMSLYKLHSLLYKIQMPSDRILLKQNYYMVIWKLPIVFPVYKFGDSKILCGPLPWKNVQSYICGPSSKALRIPRFSVALYLSYKIDYVTFRSWIAVQKFMLWDHVKQAFL
jgi:hypothetical protein